MQRWAPQAPCQHAPASSRCLCDISPSGTGAWEPGLWPGGIIVCRGNERGGQPVQLPLLAAAGSGGSRRTVAPTRSRTAIATIDVPDRLPDAQ